MKYAWIENGHIRDVCPGDPASSYTPDIAAHYTAQVPDTAKNGDAWDGTTLTPAPAPAPAPASAGPRELSRVQFLLLFTPAERIAIRASTDPGVVDWMLILNDPQFDSVDLRDPACSAALAYLVSKSLLTADRRTAILAA